MAEAKILIVDDEPINQHVFNNHLDSSYYQITTALNGADALKAIDGPIRFDLVILDVMMPGMDGFDFITELSKRRYEGALIIVSGQEKRVRHSASLVAQLSSLKYLGEIEKPVTKLQLQSFISNLLL